MSAITNVWRQLVQRRLWPVAILLIAALAGVPLALAEEPTAPAPAAPLPTADGDAALAAQPIVAQASAADRGKRRKVLGRSKNPFGFPTEEPSGSAAAPNSTGSTTAQEPSTPAPSSSGGTPPSSGGGGAPSTGGGSPSTGGGPSAPPATEPTPEPEPRKYAMHELTVRFGSATETPGRRTLERLQPLPSAEQPVLIYLGVLKDGETAVFLLDHGVQAIGDGDCRPTPEDCETIRLRAGETEFLDVVDAEGNVSAQYQLDLIKIHSSKTTSATRAKASSKAGQRLVKARVASDGPTGYRWDAAAGALERRPGHPDRTLRATVESQTVSLP